MGCNCGKRSGTTYKYIYTSTNGETTTYNSEVEAKSRWLRENKEGTYQRVEKTTAV